MRVQLIDRTQYPVRTFLTAARTCYSGKSANAILEKAERDIEEAPEKVQDFLDSIYKSGHLSIFEHACFTFAAEGISRAASHQLVRHRVATFSQQSQRYVKLAEPEYVVPESIAGDASLAALYKEKAEEAWRGYGELIEAGVPAEDARFLLPNACATNIVFTMNVRELLHFFSLRLCNRAQWEIRELAEAMLAICMEELPEVFIHAGPPCMEGACPEPPERCCGHPRKQEA